MPNMIATIDTTLRIPPYFKGLTDEDALIIEMKAETPTEVSEKVLEYYTKNRPKVFRKEGKPKPVEQKPLTEGKTLPGIFDPIKFLTDNHENIKEALENLEPPVRDKIFAIAKFLRLKDYVIQSTARIKERIVYDIDVKNKQAQKLNNTNVSSNEE